MKKFNITLSVAIAGALMSTALLAHQLPPGTAHTDAPDVEGDSLINLPKQGSTVTSKSVDVWFVQIPKATAYSVDLVGGGVAGAGGTAMANVCGSTGPTSSNRTYQMRTTISGADIDCGNETSETKSGDGDVRGLQLCKWTTPDLADGNYSLAINPILPGSADLISQQEVRNAITCGSAVAIRDAATTALGVSTASVAGNDTKGYVTNTLTGRTVSLGTLPDGTGVNTVNNSAAIAADSHLSADTFYQRFSVKDATAVASVAPSISDGVHPVNGATLFSNDNLLEFHDPSGLAGAADWYEIWIYDKDKLRVTGLANQNLTYPHWYKLTVNPALSCTSYTGTISNRICSVDLNDTTGTVAAIGAATPMGVAFAAANLNDKFYWYVRGYNDFGYSDWSAAAMFVKN